LDAKNKNHLAVEAAIRVGLKLGTQNHYLDGIPPLFIAADLFKDPRLNSERFVGKSERVAIGPSCFFAMIWPPLLSDDILAGLLLRDKVIHNPNTGSHWTSSLLFSLVQELVPLYDVDNDTLDGKNAIIFLPEQSSP